MRHLVIFALAPVLASAQTVGPEHLELALGVLRGGPLTLSLTGENTTSSGARSFRVNFYYQPAAGQVGPKVAIWSYRGDDLDRQILADGESIYRYDPVLKQYSSSAYKGVTRLNANLMAMGRGNVATPLRLFSDLLSPEPWRPWLRRAEVDTSTPLQLRYITENDAQAFIFASPFTPDAPRLVQIRGGEVRSSLTTTWSLDISTRLPDGMPFIFVPPAGSRPVSAPSSVPSPE